MAKKDASPDASPDESPDPEVSAFTRSRRERAVAEHDRTRARLLAAARDIVRRDGAFGLTVAVVAEVSGVTPMTVYRYFDGPTDMLYALSDETMQRIFARIAEHDQADRHFLDEIGRIAVEEFSSDSEVNRMTVLLAGTQRFGPDVVDQVGLLIHEHLRVRLASGQVEFDDVELAARTIITYYRGALYSWAAGFYTDDQLGTEVASAIKAGFALGGGKEVG